MVNTNILKRKVDELERLAYEIQRLGVELLEGTTFSTNHYYNKLEKPDYRSPLKETQRKVIQYYQGWYSAGYHLIETYAPEWIETFKSCYSWQDRRPSSNINLDSITLNTVMDYLKLDIYTNFKDKYEVINDFIADFDTQLSILLSIPHIIDIQELDLRKLITVDLAHTEIEQAELLFTSGFHRAAGSIAGVALELYLKTLCDINRLSYPPKATIQPLIQVLQKGGKINTTEVKHIEYLASIRNQCSHPKDVSEAEVKSLIEGVKKLI